MVLKDNFHAIIVLNYPGLLRPSFFILELSVETFLRRCRFLLRHRSPKKFPMTGP